MARSYEVNDYRTTLSLKSVVRGAARYHTPQGPLSAHAGCVPDPERRPALLARIRRPRRKPRRCARFSSPAFWSKPLPAWTNPAPTRHLDDIDLAAPALDFCERLYPKTGAVARALADLHSRIARPASFHAVARRSHVRAGAGAGRTAPAGARRGRDRFQVCVPRTRVELYRRLYRGRDFLLSCYDQPLTVAAAARVAGALAIPFPAHVQAGLRPDSHAVLCRRRACEAARRMLVANRRRHYQHLLRGGLRKPGIVQLVVPQALRCFPARLPRPKRKSQD